MRKTARPVVWEGAGAKSPAPDPIGETFRRGLFSGAGSATLTIDACVARAPVNAYLNVKSTGPGRDTHSAYQ
jgi:hypothetical protein